jgi:phosphoesterase RecJ-like protein
VSPDFDIREIIRPYQNILITGHLRPYGDAVASAFACALALRKLGKTPEIFMEPYDPHYDALRGREFLTPAPTRPEVFISVDCGSIERLPKGAKKFFDEAQVTVNIDHHSGPGAFARYNYVVPGASSAAELIYDVFENIVEIDLEIASAIYAGIVYDSGGMRYPATTARTMEIVGKLMAMGIDFPSLYAEILLKRSQIGLKAHLLSLENLEISPEINLAATVLRYSEITRFGITPAEIHGIVQFILYIDGVDTALFLYEYQPKKFRVSARSRTIDVRRVAEKFGGGGHTLASGCSMEGSFEEVKQKLIDELFIKS